MLTRAAVALGVVLAFASACSEKGRSLVLVDVDLDQTVSNLAHVEIIVSQDGRDVGRSTFVWVPGAMSRRGVFVDKGVTGDVIVAAKGFDSSDRQVAMAASTATIRVRPGEVSAQAGAVHLVPYDGAPREDAGVDGPGGMDGGTGGGSGGNSPTGSGGVAGGGGMATATGGAAAGGKGGAAAGGKGGAGKPTWRGATTVEADLLIPSWTPAVAVDDAGNAVLIYRHGVNIRASRYSASTATWSAPVAVDPRTGGQAYSPAIAVDKNGAWLAIWQQDASMQFPGIWQSTSIDGTTWTAPTAITTVAGYDPELSMNADGAAVAAWYGTSTGDGFAAFASVKTAGTWSAPLQMKPSNYLNSFPPHKVAMSGTGEAFVIWEDLDDAHAQDSVWMRRFASGVWGPATLVEATDSASADASNIAANKQGQVIIVWRQSATAVDETWARRYAPSEGWGTPAPLGQGTFIPWDPALSVTLDDAGVATASWVFEVKGKMNVYASRALHGQPWPANPMAMETDNDAAAVNNSLVYEAKPAPVVQADAQGNVVLLWRKRAGARFDLWSRRFSAGAWDDATLLETNSTLGVAFPVLGIGKGGTAVATWYFDSENLIWANVLR